MPPCKKQSKAARRFAVYHIRENGDDCHFTSDYFLSPMQAAYRYRLYERGELSADPKTFTDAFIETNPVSLEYFGEVCADIHSYDRVTALLEFDLDEGRVSVYDGTDNEWQTYSLRDFSVTAYKAFRSDYRSEECRREDAKRLGFDNGDRWRDMLRSQTQTLSENLRIPMSNLRWFAAFHNESHHPHIHLIAYSTKPNEGYLSEKGVMALRSSFAKDILAQDLLCEYKKQTEHRDALKVQSREVLAELIAKINGGTYDNPQVENLLQTLAKRLAVTNGKKQYGYLRKDIKEIINSIVDELGKDERIAALYDLWYESKETALKVYTESRPERLPLSQNKEFKSVKNMVIAEAMKLNLPTDEVEETNEPVEPDCEPTAEETESPDPPPPPMDEYEKTVADADKGNKWSQYRAAKFMLDRAAAQKNLYAAYLAGKIYLTEDEVKDIQKAIRSFLIAAENGNDYAEYQIGKIYLYGKDVPRDTDKAMYYLHLAAEHGNQYAAQLIHSIKVNGNWTAALASLRLLGHMARIIPNRLEDERRCRENSIDRKLRRKIEEKKQAHGLKQ